MEHLRSIMPDEAAPLIEYFDSSYMNEALRHRHDNQVQVEHAPDVFECWNTRSSRLLGHGKLSVWKLNECLQVEGARVDFVILQEQLEIRPVKKAKKVYDELQTRLQHMCQDAGDSRT